uniref:Secreted protein n=1 Tax=Heterorhabditis bacteriophora TaxID=37862 RepID=A0A1I7WXM5_HETBA
MRSLTTADNCAMMAGFWVIRFIILIKLGVIPVPQLCHSTRVQGIQFETSQRIHLERHNVHSICIITQYALKTTITILGEE